MIIGGGDLMQFCEVCNSIIHDGKCTNRRCASRDERLTSWLIDGVLWRFRVALTRAEAVEAVRDKADVMIKPKRNETNE
jgi:hypothetical protein